MYFTARRAISHTEGIYFTEKRTLQNAKSFFLVEEGGFEPPKLEAADLQSVPFGHSGTLPYGAGERSRTINLLITNQLLYQLSYTSA